MGKYSWSEKEEWRYNDLIKRVTSHEGTSWYKKFVKRVLQNKSRYKAIADELGVPIALIPLIEIKESAGQCGKFTMYIGNGQSLKKKTTIVPRGRGPFKTWEDGVRDAFSIDNIGKIKDWSLARILHTLEGYNGWGYRNRGKLSPYLWAFTKPNGVGTGYYVADGKYSSTAVPKSIGAYAFYMLLIEADKDFIVGAKATRDDSPKMKFDFWAWLSGLFLALFSSKKPEQKAMIEIDHIPSIGENNETVKVLQNALNRKGAKLKVDGDFGKKTLLAIAEFQKSMGSTGSGKIGPKTLEWLGLSLKKQEPSKKRTAPAWFKYAKQFEGKNENDKEFAAFMVPKWKLLGLNLPHINKNWSAWCGLAIAVALTGVGMDYQKNGAAAKNWMKYGKEINWRVDGIPQGAIVQLNHRAACGESKSNHVSMAEGDCTASHLTKKGATITLFGGNQGNTWKKSDYPVWKICAVRWPKKAKLPGKVLVSKNCTTGKMLEESTR